MAQTKPVPSAAARLARALVLDHRAYLRLAEPEPAGEQHDQDHDAHRHPSADPHVIDQTRAIAMREIGRLLDDQEQRQHRQHTGTAAGKPFGFIGCLGRFGHDFPLPQ